MAAGSNALDRGPQNIRIEIARAHAELDVL